MPKLEQELRNLLQKWLPLHLTRSFMVKTFILVTTVRLTSGRLILELQSDFVGGAPSSSGNKTMMTLLWIGPVDRRFQRACIVDDCALR